MRLTVSLLAAVAVCACTSAEPTNMNTPYQLQPHGAQMSLNASTHAVTGADGAPALEVDAWVLNRGDVPLTVAIEPDCPLLVSIFPDPTGEQYGYTAVSMYCAISGTSVAIAPGDSGLVARVIGADTLASFAPGLYGVDVNLSAGADDNTWVVGKFAGAVQLPLAGGH